MLCCDVSCWCSHKLPSFIHYRKQVTTTFADAEADGVVVPKTLEEYCIKAKPNSTANSSDFCDFYDDDDYMDDCEDDDFVYESDDDDSGNEES